MVTKVVFIKTTGAGTWTAPADFNPLNNSIVGIGAGAGAGSSATSGGGGGEWARSVNVALAANATAYYNVPPGGAASSAGGDTWFNKDANTPPVSAASGVRANGGQQTNQASNPGYSPGGTGGVGTTKNPGGRGVCGSYSGGGGGAGSYLGPGLDGGFGSSGPAGGGGGAAGGGSNGADAIGPTGGLGGNNPNGTDGGAPGVPGAGRDGFPGSGGGGGDAGGGGASGAGGPGREYVQTSDGEKAGAGGGAGGEYSGGTAGGYGGLYGGGAGSRRSATGGQGIIIITYEAVDPAPTFSGPIPSFTGTVGIAFAAQSPTLASYFTGLSIVYTVSTALPTGLSIDSDTGVISGTPSVTASWSGTVIATNSGGSQASNSFGITINPPAPTVTTQPSSASAIEGTTPTLTAAFANTPTTFLWEYADSPYSSWATVVGGSGAATTAYTLPALTLGVTGRRFRCTATNAGGSVTTNGAAEITVIPIVSPAITVQPTDQTRTAPSTATFSLTATGTPTPTYQWQRNPGGNTAFADIGGATSASYTTPATTVTGGTANNADTYRCVVTNTGGTVTSSIVTLSVAAPLDVEAPVMTGVLVETAITTNSFTLSWSAATDNMSVVGYELSLDGGTTWFPVGNVLTYPITGRTPGSTSNCRVRAYDLTPNYSNELTKSVTVQSTTVVTDPLENLSGSLYLSTTIHYSWFPGGRIGALTGITPVEGTGTSHATTGALTIPNLELGSGVILTCVRDTNASTDGIHYQALTVTAV